MHRSTSPSTILAEDITTLRASDDEYEALRRMREHCGRRLPVVGRNAGLVGIVTLDDLLEVFAEELSELADVPGRQRSREAVRREPLK